MAIYGRLKKRRGRAKIIARRRLTLSSGLPYKLVFVHDMNNDDWLAILSTDIDLPCQQKIIRIYAKRWDIGVFFQYDQATSAFGKRDSMTCLQCPD
jgi:hypothetical protein